MSPDMAFWSMPHRPDSSDREPSFFWQGLDTISTDDGNDFFGQFVDFDGNTTAAPGATLTGTADVLSTDQTVPRLPENFLLDHPTESTSSSTADEFDFLSSSSHLGPTSSVSQDVDPNQLTANPQTAVAGNNQVEALGRGSISDTDLPRVENMTLISPTKNKQMSLSQPSSPTPPNTTARKSTNKFVEAVQSTIRKATTRRKPRKPLPDDTPGSPTGEAPLKAPRQRPRKGAANNKKSVTPPMPQNYGGGNQAHPFIHGACDDPFNEVPPLPPPQTLRYFHQGGITPPLESPAIKSEPGSYYSDHTTSQMPPESPWHQPPHPNSVPQTQAQWNGAGEMATNDGSSWLDWHMWAQNQEFVDQKNSQINMVMHSQQAELPYEYQHQIPDTATTGLMIQMPQPPHAGPVPANLAVSAPAQVPHLPPQPATAERLQRPPRAPSSGARHLSCSPIRKTRAPSASPTRTTPSGTHKRHSSGASVTSTRSASGRLPASMPGTPCSVRKRRSRDPSGSSMGGLDGGGGGVGFVNFTPSDGGMLMTGVAPSGSSKTKARREKEASDRRKKLSEAAIKAVAAAGGDVEQLMQQGFSF